MAAYGFRFGFLLLLAAKAIAAESPVDLTAVVVANRVDHARSTLLVVRLGDGQEWQSGRSRIEQRFVPASTSKIPHTLIALETGYADGPDTEFEWDGEQRFFEAWNQDQTLASAYRFSAVWVYQQIARDLGSETMGNWLEEFDYGNHDVGGEDDLTTYWLQGPLEISAREQVEFLARLARHELPVSDDTMAKGREVMLADEGNGWKLFAKTGWKSDGESTDLGWYVGWLEGKWHGEPETWVFAFNLDMPEEDDRFRRAPTVRMALELIGAIPD